MKCMFSGEETNSLCNNYPVSPSARSEMKLKHQEYNDLIKLKFKERLAGVESDKITDEFLNKFSPKVGIKKFLQQVNQYGVEKLFEETINHK